MVGGTKDQRAKSSARVSWPYLVLSGCAVVVASLYGYVAVGTGAPASSPLAVTTTSVPPVPACVFLRPCTEYSAALSASGGTPGYTWTLTSGGLPNGLALQAGGTISGTPFFAQAGSYPVTVQVTDSTGASAQGAVTLVVGGSGTSSTGPLAIVTTAVGPVIACVFLHPCPSYAAALSASGGTPAYTWSVASGSLPNGLVLQPGGVVTGTPFFVPVGSYPVTFRVTDATGATAVTTLTLVVVVDNLTIVTTSLPQVQGCVFLQPCSSYTGVLVANDGFPGYTWSVASGSLPNGLVLQPGGVVTGTPFFAPAGSYPVTVQVTDAAGAVAQTTLTLVVT